MKSGFCCFRKRERHQSGYGDFPAREQHERDFVEFQSEFFGQSEDERVRAVPDEGHDTALLREAPGQNQSLHG
jgi:hypothetical protein